MLYSSSWCTMRVQNPAHSRLPCKYSRPCSRISSSRRCSFSKPQSSRRSSSVSARFCAPASGSSRQLSQTRHPAAPADRCRCRRPGCGVCIGAAGTDDLLQLTHVPLIRILHQHLVCLTRHLHPAADALLLLHQKMIDEPLFSPAATGCAAAEALPAPAHCS